MSGSYIQSHRAKGSKSTLQVKDLDKHSQKYNNIVSFYTKKYLKLIPHAWKLIENRINNNIIFADLKNYLDDNFSMKTRMKK